MSGTLLSTKDSETYMTHFFAQGNNSLVIFHLPAKSPRIIFSTPSFSMSFKMLLNLVLGENFSLCASHHSPNFVLLTQLNHIINFQCSLSNAYKSHLPSQIINNSRA